MALSANVINSPSQNNPGLMHHSRIPSNANLDILSVHDPNKQIESDAELEAMKQSHNVAYNTVMMPFDKNPIDEESKKAATTFD